MKKDNNNVNFFQVYEMCSENQISCQDGYYCSTYTFHGTDFPSIRLQIIGAVTAVTMDRGKTNLKHCTYRFGGPAEDGLG